MNGATASTTNHAEALVRPEIIVSSSRVRAVPPSSRYQQGTTVGIHILVFHVPYRLVVRNIYNLNGGRTEM